jgi:hypothetical protein
MMFGLLARWFQKVDRVALTYAMPAEFSIDEIRKMWEEAILVLK